MFVVAGGKHAVEGVFVISVAVIQHFADREVAFLPINHFLPRGIVFNVFFQKIDERVAAAGVDPRLRCEEHHRAFDRIMSPPRGTQFGPRTYSHPRGLDFRATTRV